MTNNGPSRTSTTFRIAQISDTHLSATHAYFVDNLRVLTDELQRRRPGLVVHSGDVSFNGPVAEPDLDFAKAEMQRIGTPWRIIPGNHDVGEAPRYSRLDQPLTDQRITAWKQRFGDLWWTQDIGAWRLIGLDTSLFASDRAEEKDQRAFLRDSLIARAGRSVLLFMHMPPFVDDADDPKPTTHAIPFETRLPFLELCLAGGVRAIACGHLHVYRRMQWRGIEIVWAPCTSFVHIARWQKHFGGFARSGYVEWTLDGESLSHSLIEPPSLITHDMGLWSDAFGTTTKLPPRPISSATA